MKIHWFGVVWNERRILPHFFAHYESQVDHFHFFDDGSTDGTREILMTHPQCTVTPINPPGSICDFVSKVFREFWKGTDADWAIIGDLDELVTPPEKTLREYLALASTFERPALCSRGYQLVADTFPDFPNPLPIFGFRDRDFDKVELVNCAMVERIEYSVGHHFAAVFLKNGTMLTNANLPSFPRPILRHARYLGFDYVKARHAELNGKIRKEDKAKGYCFQYAWSDEEIRKVFAKPREIVR